MIVLGAQNLDNLQKAEDMRWMDPNTNHLPAHPLVKETLLKDIDDQSYNLYALP
jgi:histidinol-phosphate aminotransferase